MDASNCPYGQNIEGCNWETSTLKKCAFLALCNWYTPLMCCSRVDQWASGFQLMSKGGGYCSNPSCAGTEFFYHMVAAWSGQGTSRVKNVGEELEGGSPFPGNRFGLESKMRAQGYACGALLEEMLKPEYAIMPGALFYSYAPALLTRTTTSTTTTSTTSTTTTSTTTTSTTTTDTVTTTTSTTTTLPTGVSAEVKGIIYLSCPSAVSFITDPMATYGVQLAIAETAGCPEYWVSVTLDKHGSRFLREVDSIYEALANKVRSFFDRREEGHERRLGLLDDREVVWGVTVDYTIIVPSNNRERITGMWALETIMRQPLYNITRIVRTKVYEAIGTTAGLQVTGRTQPSLGSVNYVPEYVPTTTRGNFSLNWTSGHSSPPKASRSCRHSMHVVVLLLALVLPAMRATSFFDS